MFNVSFWNLLFQFKRSEQMKPKKIVINVRQSLQKVIIIKHLQSVNARGVLLLKIFKEFLWHEAKINIMLIL